MASNGAEKSKARILCVDDDPAQLTLLEKLLSAAFQVDTAHDGEQALQKLENEGPYAVIVSDMAMPRIDGAEFLQRARYVAPETMRILLTAHGDFETAMRAVNEAYVFKFITKPWQASHLRNVLHQAVAQYEISTDHQDGMMDLVFRDDLTRLFNRRYFDIAHPQEHARCLRHDRRYALVFIDLDGLKAVNTQHGHVVGGKVIEAIGGVIAQLTRKSDMAFRFGGDEFVTLLIEANPAGILQYTERVLQGISALEVEADGEMISLTASAGIAILTDEDRTPQAILERADQAMYEAKRRGKNQVIIDPPME